jgi:hypothetical protein
MLLVYTYIILSQLSQTEKGQEIGSLLVIRTLLSLNDIKEIAVTQFFMTSRRAIMVGRKKATWNRVTFKDEKKRKNSAQFDPHREKPEHYTTTLFRRFRNLAEVKKPST